MRTRRDREKKPTSWTVLLIMAIVAGLSAWYIIFTQRGIDLEYDQAEQLAHKTATSDQKQLDLNDGAKVFVPTLQLFAPNHTWMYVSKSAVLGSSYRPTNLVNITLPTGASDSPMQLRSDVNAQLQSLFARAKDDGVSFMVSSAYRSIADQQKVYDEFVAKKGEAMAQQYVLTPGASEHHTGYALDVTDASTACTKNSDSCNLSPASAEWLAEHAPDFGFIIRYPGGKEPITGIAHEPWHLRYVGVILAKQLTDTDMTFDEFIEQVAPGRLEH